LDLWRQQISLIMEQHGLISFIIHPDYLNTSSAKTAYRALLAHLSELRESAEVWIALPGEIDTWWRQRSRLKLAPEGNSWKILGAGADRATLAYASIKNDKIHYELA
jgi:hypothetical protein